MTTPNLISIHRDGQNSGPYTEDQVRQYIASGNLLPSDMAWYEGLENWQTLGSLPEFSACFSQSTATAPPRTPVQTGLQFPTPEALRTQPDPEGQSQGIVPTKNRSKPNKRKVRLGLILFGLVMVGGIVLLPSLSCFFLMAGFVALIAFAAIGGFGSGGDGSGSSCSSCGGGD